VEAAVMQPSHYNGQPNVLHFIPEAQPKKRTDDASVASSEDIAANMNPEEITSSVTAYTGAPTLNARGETIQGNNRTAALKRMWESHADQAAKYKQYLMDHAGEFGLNADDIAQMKQPVLANIVDVDDAKAIELGQYDVKDTESGGTERIKAKNAVVKMGTDMKHFASVLLSSSDDEASFSQLVDKNGDTVLKWMNQKGYITPTQYKSAFDSKGNLTAEAANDLKGIMYQSIFQNGNERLEEVFNTLPAKAQRAILATMYRDYDSPAAERMVPEVQASIMAYNELMQNDSFAGAKNMKEAQMAVMMWQRQYQFDDATGESYLPTEKYSNFALQLAAMYRVQTQSLIQGTFNQMFDLIQGTQEANLFNQDTLDNTPRTLVEAIKEALNIDYNGQQRNNVLAGNSAASQQRKQRSRGDASADGRGESGSRTAEREGGTESNSGRSENSQGNRGLQEQRDEGVQEVHVGLGEKETDGLLSQMEANAAEMPQLELNPSNWVSQFGEEGTVRTPIGQVKMGVNQIAKLFEKGRSEQFGMIKPTLENPQVIIEVPSESNDGNTERSSSLLFVKTFVGKDGKKIYYFKSVTVKKDGLEVSVSSHYDRVKRVKEALKNGKLLYRFDGGAQTEHHPADVSVTTSHEKGQGFSSADKVTNNHRELQTNNEKNTGREEDSLSSKIAAASEEVNTEPTEAQKEAGNYKKGHVQVGTFDITIEQPEGSIRRGTDANGKQWESKMHNTYGYFRGTEGVDGDHIDVFLSTDIDGWNGHKVYVVDQYNPDGTFDEHKVMLGFNDMDEAKSDYLANYEKGWENGRRIDVTAVNLEDFEKWIASSHRKTKPFGEYSSVKKDTDTTVKTGAYTIAPAQYTTKRGKVLDMQLVKFANELSKEQQRAAAAMAKEMKGWYDRSQGGFLMRSEEDARKLAEAVAENGEQLADAAPLSVSDLQEADEKQKEIGKAVEQTISDIVDTLSKDKVVVGTLKNSPNNPAFENLVYEKAQAIIIGDTERNLSNGVLKAFDNNELYRKIEKLVRERVNEDIFQKAERIAKEEEKKRTVKKPKSKEKEKPKNSGQFGLVSDERMEELKKRLRQKLGGQLNMGIDPEILAIGMELAAGHIDRGIKKFADFAKVMVEDMGDVIRPYLKAFYNGVRDMPEVGDNGLAAEMTPYDEVRTFDVANFDKATPDALATAEQVVAEHEAEKQAKTATKKLKEKRNEAAKKLKTSKPAKEAADNFYNNGINEDAVAALPEDDAIHLHVVDILNPGMTDNSMKSKIDNFTYLLPKISDGKLAELDKEYGDDKIMGSHIKAEINRREEAKIDATDLPKLAKEKAKSALHGNGSMTDNAALAEAKRRIDKKRKTKTPQTEQRSLFDEPITNENDNGLQRDDDAVRTEAVQADRSGHGEGLSERTESGSKASEKGREAVDGTGARKGTGTDRTVQPRPANAVKEKRNTRNNHAERGEEFAPKSVDARIDANIKAIELAHELLESGEIATPEQMAVLRRFSGWGGLGAALGDGGYDWKRRERNQKIRELLGNEAYEQAVLSANSAYYTPAYVVDTLWDIAAQLGFKGGRILEGSAGIGNILGQMPTAVSERSNIHAVEIDGTSGGILSLLYPDAKVEIQGFEQTRIPNGSVDLAITNVPFVAGMRVKDTTGDSDLAKKFYIQDFCIAKNVRKLREGGLGIFITSNGTLDSSKKLREWVTNEGGADFVGAFRMNNKTFGGTPVTSDIIVIRKRVNGQPSPNAIDVSTISGERMAEYDTGETRKVKGKEVPVVKQLSMDYNKYFIEHPENMAGEMHFGFEKGDTYRPTSKGLYPMSGKEQKQMLESFVLSLSKEEGAEKSTAPSADDVNSMVYDKLGKDVKEGSMVVDKNGRICLAQYGEAVPVMSKPKTGENASEEELIKRFQYKKIKKHTKAECFQSYSEIKTALNDVLAYQKENEGDEGLQPLLDKLNKAYDDFVKTYGHFNKNGQLAWLRRDVDYANVASVETFEERGDKNGNLVQTFGKADVMNGRVVEKEQEPHPENVKDGVVVSMFQSGRIDVPYIASQLGMSEEDVKQEIIDSGLGFEDPASRQMEVSYQYLSGNVREKLRLARENNEGGRYDKNIKALEDVKPMDIPSHLIDFTLGSSWIDSKLYDEYVKDRTDVDVHFTAVGGTWFMNAPEYGLNMEKNRAMGVTSEMLHRTVFGHALIEAAIQNRTITVSQTQKKWDGTTETITDREATQACAAKIDEIRQDFKEWARQKMQSDAEMSQRMERVYNDTFNNYVPMRIPDDFVPEYFGGASHKFKMRPHQGRAIVRGTMQPLLLAHEVGTGKTFTLISTAMEMRRLGTAHKPMIVVQNATVGQFVASAKELYPNAKILTLEDADRNAEGRKNFYAKIKYNDWDMIVVPQSTFEFIPDSEEREMAFVQDKIHEKEMVLEKMRETDKKGNSMILRQAERELNDLNNQLATLSDKASKKRNANDEKKKAVARQNATVKAQEMLDRRTDDVDNFDDMGIDALLIDEAHEYKHLGFATAMQRGVKGVDSSYSKKSQGVYLKTQAVLEKNHGRNVVFATGTPISNTAAEIWTFMRYLMPKDTMEEYGIYYFDDFVRNFGNIQQMLEFTTSGKFKENNRFAGYVNLPELVRIWSSVSDTVLTREAGGVKEKIPELEGGKAQDLYLPQTRALRSIMKYVKHQLDEYDKMSGKEKKENSHIPLTMYGIAKAAAVDARLVQSDAEDDGNSKTNEAVRQTLRSLKETESYKGTVAIFADNYQNKHSGFNLYEDIRQKLIEQGVPANEIVVMKSGMTVKKKLDIFDKVNRGEVRVILGSTFTLGTGVNIQERLHTLIHLDAPNRPMDYTQRNGRILRQGNLHKEMGKPVRVLRFGVEDSLDVTAYQRLKTKGAIADSVMNGKELMQDSMNNRVLEEDEDVFGDTVAQLSGSEYAMLKNNAEKNVRKYESRRKQWEADQTYIHNAKPRLEGKIKADKERAEKANKHLFAVQTAFPDGKAGSIKVGKKEFASVDAMADFIKEHNKKILDEVKAMKDNPKDETRTHTLTLSMGGYDFTVKTEMQREMSSGGGQLFAEVHRKMTYSCQELGLENVPVKQSLLRNAIEDITENVITGKDFAEREELPMDKASEEDMFRDGNSVDYEKAQARNRYEERVSRGMYQMQEAMQDSMLGLKEAMDAILGAEGKKQYIEDVAGYENAYLGENRLSSVNQAECTAFARTLFKPLLEEVAKLAKTADERAELTDYMMAKHGLERNEVMRERAKEKLIEEKMGKEKPKEPNPDDDDYDIKMVAYDAAMDAWENAVEVKLGDKLSAIEERDFSGLTALTGMNNVVDAEAEAQRMVSDYESNHDTADLWGRVNDVTSATLSKTYESGLISKTTYDDIRTMYKHYIPLRGFDDKTSDEAYAYLQDKHSAFNAPIKTAKGRKSKADDPFANMESMAESAIMQGNRNVLVKQKFLNFVLNHPSDLVSVSDLWLRYDDTADEWKPVNTGDVAGTERLEETDSPAEVERKMQDFEAAMEQLAAQEPDKWKKQKENPAIPYRVVESRDLRQHQVLVKRGGKDYLLTINGNPRAAQALNGQTNPDNDTSGAIGAILHAGEVLNRHLSAFYTTRNPDFVVSNFMRDALYANTMVWVKESPNYAIRFHKNFGKVNPAKMKMLFGKLRNGTLDMNDEVEKMFHQFMMNGGETGYANIRDIEQRKNDIKRELKKYNGKLPIRKAWDLLGERFDEYNRAVENCARFAAFMTSRQMKRSIDRSIYDAKEISVNFNKKGSGAKFMGAVGQTKTGNIAAFVSGLGRSGYVFWNAALQGATNFGRQTMQHPKKALVGMAAMFLLGVLTAGFGGGDGDDDDDKNSYYNLPEYVRRSNIVFRMPWMKEQWISIPLPVEYRSMYGMGELMTSVISGKEHYTGGEIANQIAGQMSQMLPIDFMEGGGSFKAFVPSAVKPYAEVMTNKGWTGMPLYKDTPYNQDMPEWTKAYKSANKYLVGLSKTLNDISGGDAYTKGLVDINPAKVEYLLNGYFGGVSTTIDKLTKTGETILGDREYDPRSFLILNRLVKNGDERTENRAINNEYFRLKEEHDKLKARLKHYEDDTDNGVFDYAEKIDWLYNSPEYRRLEIFEDYAPDIDAINKELKEPMSDAERKQLEADLNEIKKDLVEEVNKTRKRK
jgi:N12 class adenine-specific DNA methylase